MDSYQSYTNLLERSVSKLGRGVAVCAEEIIFDSISCPVRGDHKTEASARVFDRP
jgi:hypothetical protein